MTADELIKMLQRVPPNTPVYCIEQGRAVDEREIVDVHKIIGDRPWIEVVYSNV